MDKTIKLMKIKFEKTADLYSFIGLAKKLDCDVIAYQDWYNEAEDDIILVAADAQEIEEFCSVIKPYLPFDVAFEKDKDNIHFADFLNRFLVGTGK